MVNENFNIKVLKYKYRFFFTLDYLLKKVGIDFSNWYIFSRNLDDFVFKESKTDNVILKVCKEDDLHLFGELKDRFLQDLQDGHVLVGAFLNGDWVGYNWVSFKPVEVEEVERFIHFNGAYMWRAHVKEDYRRMGIAKKMVNFSFGQIKNTYKKNKAYAIVETTNVPSIKVCESNGFSKIGTLKFSRFFLWSKYKEEIDDDTVTLLED